MVGRIRFQFAGTTPIILGHISETVWAVLHHRMAVLDPGRDRTVVTGDPTSAPDLDHPIVGGHLVPIDRSHVVDDVIEDPQQLRKPQGQGLYPGEVREIILDMMRGTGMREADCGRPHTRRDSQETLQETLEASTSTCGVVLWGKRRLTHPVWVLQYLFHTCPLLMEFL